MIRRTFGHRLGKSIVIPDSPEIKSDSVGSEFIKIYLFVKWLNNKPEFTEGNDASDHYYTFL